MVLGSFGVNLPRTCPTLRLGPPKILAQKQIITACLANARKYDIYQPWKGTAMSLYLNLFTEF
jgi:hypothetical protein